jgi:hypothetical protein
VGVRITLSEKDRYNLIGKVIVCGTIVLGSSPGIYPISLCSLTVKTLTSYVKDAGSIPS